VHLTSPLSMELALALLAHSSMFWVNACHASMDARLATHPLLAPLALNLCFSKATNVSQDADQDFSRMDLSALLAQLAVLAAQDPIFVSSAFQANSHTMASATTTVLLDQSGPTLHLVLSVILLARPAQNTPASVPAAPHAAEISSTSNVWISALLELTPSMELVNTAPTTARNASEATQLVPLVLMERFSLTELAMTNVLTS